MTTAQTARLMAVLAGMAAAMPLILSWSRWPTLPPLTGWVLVLICGVALAVPAYFALRLVRPQWARLRRRDRALYVVAAVLAGWLLTWMIPLQPAPSSSLKLEVASLGEGSALSSGSEVWARVLVDGRALELSDVDAGPTWTPGHGYLISPVNSPPDRFTWAGTYANGVQLELFTHAWSGQAVVRWNGQERQFDLYSLEGGAVKLQLAGSTETPQFLHWPARSPLQHLVQLCQSITLGLALLLLVSLAQRYPSPHMSPHAAVHDRSIVTETLVAAASCRQHLAGYLHARDHDH